MNAKPLLLAALLGGCATTPHNLQQDLAQSAIPAAWMFQNSDRAANSHREWWRGYGSAALDQLIARGLAHNQNLAAAGYAWQKSRIALENSDVNRGADYSGGVNASAGRNLSHGGHSNQNYGSSLGINYQADLWGKLRLASDNAAWESQATAEDLLATRLSLIGDIINQYLQIASLNDQLALNAAYRKNAAQTLDLTRTKVHAGSASPLDLRAAQYRLQQNLGNIAIAERDFYPDLTLGANLGTSANRLLELLHNPIGAITANITLPFLNAHKKELARREAETSYQQNLANYRQTLYRALGETQNAILNLKQSQDEARHLQERLAQAKDIENLTRSRYQAGAASLQDVLDKENATRGVEESLLTNRYEQLTRSLTLHLALGGNLQDNESARPQPSPTAREGE